MIAFFQVTFLFAIWSDPLDFGPEFFLPPPVCLLCAHLRGALSSSSSPALFSLQNSDIDLLARERETAARVLFSVLPSDVTLSPLPSELFHGFSSVPGHRKTSLPLEKELFFSVNLASPFLGLPRPACCCSEAPRLPQLLSGKCGSGALLRVALTSSLLPASWRWHSRVR